MVPYFGSGRELTKVQKRERGGRYHTISLAWLGRTPAEKGAATHDSRLLGAKMSGQQEESPSSQSDANKAVAHKAGSSSANDTKDEAMHTESKPHNDRSDSAVRNVAVWRMIFFVIMLYEWTHDQVLTPFGLLDLTMSTQSAGKDRWFAYSHLEWVQDLHAWLGQDPYRATVLNRGGLLLGFLAAFGKELRVPCWRWYTLTFTALYSIQFWAKATNFTNHNYLFPLLMLLTVFSGGGSVVGKHTKSSRRFCQAAIVAMRAQVAIMYLFASLWKMHPDWFTGRIVRRIFLNFEVANKARGVPWSQIEERLPNVFVFVAMFGFVLDFSMAMVLWFFKPTPSSTRIFLTFTLMFHLSTSVTMAQIIGYSFPATCIAALMIFLPFTYRAEDGRIISCDKRLISWLGDFATTIWPKSKHAPKTVSNISPITPCRWQKVVVLVWVGWQLYMPLRMFLLSGGNFAYNRLGYRYSWTMMLHDMDFGISHKHPDGMETVLLLAYFVPTCFLRGQRDAFMPRTIYMGPQAEHPMEDSRTAPLHQMLGTRESAMLQVFPSHLIDRVGAGIASVVDTAVGGGACHQLQGYSLDALPQNPRMGIHAVYFGRLNDRGPYSRLVDPTVDLVSVMEARRNHSYATTLWHTMLDQRPAGHEFILHKGIGSMRVVAQQVEVELKLHFPDKTVHFIADRASCLDARPVWLAPLGNTYGFIPLRLPFGTSLNFKFVNALIGSDVKSQVLELGKLGVLSSTSLEIGIHGMKPGISLPCGETIEEDVLIAVLH